MNVRQILGTSCTSVNVIFLDVCAEGSGRVEKCPAGCFECMHLYIYIYIHTHIYMLLVYVTTLGEEIEGQLSIIAFFLSLIKKIVAVARVNVEW